MNIKVLVILSELDLKKISSQSKNKFHTLYIRADLLHIQYLGAHLQL